MGVLFVGMKRLVVLAMAAAFILGATPGGADAAAYSHNPRVAAHLSQTRRCLDADTVYVVKLTNRSRYDRHFRSYELMHGDKVISERREWTVVPPHTAMRIRFLVAAGEAEKVVVTFRDEVLLTRHISGVCY